MNPGDVIEVVCDDKLNHAYGFNGHRGFVVDRSKTMGGDTVPGCTVVSLLGLAYRIWFYDKNLKVLNADS